MKPLVTVCIPSHRLNLLPEAIASVERQTYPQDRIQLLVNYSQFYTPSKINEMPELARGKYLITLPDDDLLREDALERFVREAEHSGSDLVFSNQELFGDRTCAEYQAGSWTHEGFRRENPLLGLTWLVRREWFWSLNGFDTYQIYQDWEFGYHSWRKGARVSKINLPLVRYRYHAAMESRGPGVDHAEAKRRLYARWPQLLDVQDATSAVGAKLEGSQGDRL